MNAAPAAPSVRVYRSIDQIPAETLQLFAAAEQHYPEFAAGWFANLQQTVYPDDPGVRYYVAERAGRPVAILPVRLTHRGLVRSIDSLSNYYTSLYAPLLDPRASVADLSALLRAASADHGGAHVIRLLPMAPEADGFHALLAALRDIDWMPFRFFCFGNWTLQVEQPWTDYLKHREGKLRSTIKRMGKKFVADGGTFDIVTDGEFLESASQAFNDVYKLSWKKPEPYPLFIPGLIRWLSTKKHLRLGIARLGDRPIAAQLWIVNHGKASIFKLAYDEAYAAYSPGTLLTAHMMEHVIDRDGVREVDYLVGDDDYKKMWMNRRRERWGIIAYNPRTVAGLALLTKEIAGRALRKAIQMTRQTATPNPSLRWEVLPIHRFGEYAARWDSLQQACANLPFLDSAFLQPLLEEFGTGREILALASEGGALCAAAILIPKRIGIWQTFQPAQLPLGAWVSGGKHDIADLAKSLTRALPGIGLSISITQVDPLYQPRPADDPCTKTMDYINTAWVDIDQPFESYWEARGKNLKTNMRKQRVKLKNENTALALDCIRTPTDVARAVEDYGALESAGWKGKDGTAVHPDNAQGRFYCKMLENFCTQGRGRIYRYRFNDKVVAMDLCIESGDRIVILKTAYDETYKTISPSTLMRQDEFGEFYNEGKLKRIEFYGKVMEWHTRWTDNSRTLYHLACYRWPALQAMHEKLRDWRSNKSVQS